MPVPIPSHRVLQAEARTLVPPVRPPWRWSGTAHGLGRRLGLAVLAVLLVIPFGVSGSASARPFPEPDDRILDRHGHYRSRDGSKVHQPAKSLDGTKPTGATARCRDGTWSFSHTPRGTCSRHGGVAQWAG
ncbi:DUF3761 domain-containing protein [Methylobacterium phyllosphaerae]